MNLAYRIYDPLHGFIRFDAVERDLIDSIAFQRLHHLHQLGIAYLVYPGATHSRFEHSLGVMELSSRIFDLLEVQLSSSYALDLSYYKRIVRLAALCHDMGHLPFSHVAEKLLLGDAGHEKLTVEIIKSAQMKEVLALLQKEYPSQNVQEDILKTAVGEKKLSSLGYPLMSPFTDYETVFSEIITGDFFGADRIDYLLRDARCTGVSHGLFDYHQLIETLSVVTDPQTGKIRLAIDENGIQACEALLLARHFMHQRVYQYPSVKAYSFHLARFMKSLYKDPLFSDLSYYLSQTDSTIICKMQEAFLNPSSCGYEDASALLQRKNRFTAVSKNKILEEKSLTALREKLHLSDSEFFVDFEREKKSAKERFLVKKKNGTLAPSSECLEFTIPSTPVTWIYLPSRAKQALLTALESL